MNELLQRSLSGTVQNQIEELLLQGKLQGGDKLNEVELAELFGTSRGPIREACKGLVQAGLLTAIPNRGVFVRKMDLREVLEVYDIRAFLDQLIGQLAAMQGSERQVEELVQIHTRLSAAVQLDDFEQYYPENLAFHQKLLEMTGSQRLTAMYSSLVKELHLFRRKGLIQRGSMDVSNAEHELILQAITAKDPIRTGLAMKNHVMTAKQRLIMAIEQQTSETV
ncbi:FCD domain-containing protein [Litorivicinus sp.]|nr:FCD domain-containing protein [Litorivicinus sp.]MDC1239798.1 FCD domain-containing protein [Litorivicinus sp.]MDC1466543.1 FCD domain-containing protein [Litorivicinus sp.]